MIVDSVILLLQSHCVEVQIFLYFIRGVFLLSLFLFPVVLSVVLPTSFDAKAHIVRTKGWSSCFQVDGHILAPPLGEA